MKTSTLRALVLFLGVAFTVAAAPGDYLKKPASWFTSPEGQTTLSNVLSWQSPLGDWPKNMDTSRAPNRDASKKISGTFDNGATTGELRLLARAHALTGNADYQAAFLKGLNHILTAQYPNGGWPQSFPPGKGYPRHITFNDNSMVRLMEFLREVANAPEYEFAGPELRRRAQQSFARGLDCILRCQVKVNGKRTAWCAQHDEVTLEPRSARAYELVSLSGSESAGILKLLMSIDNPGEELRQSITSAAAWYRDNPVRGLRLERRNGERVSVADPNAPLLWARFYEIETMRPIYCDRDGIKKYDFMQIGKERRNGYAWLGTWGKDVEIAFEKWQKKHNQP